MKSLNYTIIVWSLQHKIINNNKYAAVKSANIYYNVCRFNCNIIIMTCLCFVIFKV